MLRINLDVDACNCEDLKIDGGQSRKDKSPTFVILFIKSPGKDKNVCSSFHLHKGNIRRDKKFSSRWIITFVTFLSR